MPPVCEICRRAEGCTDDRSGVCDGVPLGLVERCDTCGRLACPDCLHEADCCFVEMDDHADDPHWSPPGWRVTHVGEHGGYQWERVDDAANREE